MNRRPDARVNVQMTCNMIFPSMTISRWRWPPLPLGAGDAGWELGWELGCERLAVKAPLVRLFAFEWDWLD